MTRPNLKIVGKPASVPYGEARGIRRIATLRNQLLAASVRYVKDGKSGSVNDRVRECSDWSGIPRTLIEVEIKR